MKAVLKFIIPSALLLLVFSAASFTSQTVPWTAPESADTLLNPLKNDSKAVTEGKKLYDKYCWTCHGKTGIGDGPASKNLNPKPADHTSEVVQKQSDGAIWWKITKGRGQMAPYEKTLNKTQRWQLVCYIRSLAPAVKTK